MKNIYFFIVIFMLLFISSCNEKTIEINNMTEIDGEYYQTIDENSEFITITDYVNASNVYVIETHPELKIIASSIYLNDGENLIVIKFNNNEYKLHFYKKYKVSIEIYDELNNELYSFKTLANSKLNFSDIEENITIPSGYYWDGTVIYNDETININELNFTKDTKLVAVFTSMSYNITVKSDQDLFDEYTINLNTKDVIEINVPKIPGYVFSGVYANNEIISDGMNYSPNLGTEFIVKYEKEKYILTYQFDNTEKIVEITYNDIIEEFIPTKQGYTFTGWKLDDIIFSNEKYEFYENITLSGNFIPNIYEITYDNDGIITKENVTYNEAISLNRPVKEGYEFIGWYLDNQLFTNTIYQFDKNITLVAKWEKVQETIKVDLNLEAFGGSVDNNAIVNSNNLIELPTPSKEEYTFLGWYYDVNYQNEVIDLNYLDYNNELLYAKYKYNNDGYVDSFVISKFNEHIITYDVLTMFDDTQSGFTSKYWHKIGVSLIGNGYYITGIAQNGEALSTLGEYDFVILAYTDYDLYSSFSKMNVDLGYRVIFSESVNELLKGDTCLLVSFVFEEVDFSSYYKEISDHLTSIYSKYTEINENIELVDSYNNISISWSSSNKEVISSTGIFRSPKNDTKVTLSAFVNKEKIYEFTINVKGTGGTKALATGYIYTPYNTITQNAMNTLDIIYCAFLDFDKNGDFTNLTRMTNNINNYIKPLAEKSGTKIVISINQGESGAFSSVAASPTLREKVANNTLEFIKNLNLDGVDVDWEVPSSDEIENFTLLMKTIYEKFKNIYKNY